MTESQTESVNGPESPSTPKQPSVARVVGAGSVGTIVEYFDFLIYATISGLVFGELFFPGDDEFVATMLVWATFAVGYLARPLGGILFGHFGDKIGRSRVLFVTLTMMGTATLVIGLLPTYSQIGVAAPIILILMRIVQGLGVGGEYGGAALMVIEHTHGSHRRGLFGALVSSSASFGFLLASGLMAVLTTVTTPAQFAGWAWRIPFLLSAVLLGVGFYIRYRLGETPVMRDALKNHETVKVPLLELFRAHTKQVLIALGVPFGLLAAYYVIVIFSVPFAVGHGVGQSFLLTMSTIAQVVYLVSTIVAGHISDKRGRRLPMMVGAVGLGVWAFAFFPLLLTGSTVGILLAFTVALVFMGLIYGPLAAFLAELFGTGVRFTGLSFGYQVSAAIAGGLSPIVAAFLVHATNSWIPVAGMVALALVVTFVAALASRERTDVDLSHEQATSSH